MQIGTHRIDGFASAGLGSLGRWVAISGAAASPGAGAYTTPGWTALLFLGGARLGYWLGVGDASRTHGSAAPGQRSVHAWLRDAFNAAKMGRLYAEFRAVCDQLNPRAWMQDRQGGDYWALRVPGEASPQSSASASASAPAAARGRPQPVPLAPIEQTPVQVESVDSKPRAVDPRDLDAPDA